MPPKTLFDKVWDRHIVTPETGEHPAVFYIDLHLIHEVTSPQAFTALKDRGLTVRRPDRTLATIDHSTPTKINPDGSRPYVTPQAERQVETLLENTRAHGIETHGWDSENRGIVHVMGPELGATQPGMSIVCGDSHTSTHGAFGGITPKDVILHIIAKIGVGGGTGYALEYRGNVFEQMSMEGRMTVCNICPSRRARAAA